MNKRLSLADEFVENTLRTFPDAPSRKILAVHSDEAPSYDPAKYRL